MTRAGYLRVRRGGRIELSAKGKGAAQHLVLRHRLAEKLLTEIIGLEWSRAHEEAERLEHGISPEVARLLLARFGRDSRCPHGVPLFGGMSRLRRKHGAVKLSETEVGHTYEILRVYEKDPAFLEFLEQRHLRPTARVRVLDREYDETMSLTVAGHGSGRIHLGKPATERLWVRRSARDPMLNALRYYWIISKGHRLTPWKSPYIQWRMETFFGHEAANLSAGQFFALMWRERARMERFLGWVAEQRAGLRSSK